MEQHPEDQNYYFNLPVNQVFDRVLNGGHAYTSDWIPPEVDEYNDDGSDLEFLPMRPEDYMPEEEYINSCLLFAAGMEWLRANSRSATVLVEKLYQYQATTIGMMEAPQDSTMLDEVIFTLPHIQFGYAVEDMHNQQNDMGAAMDLMLDLNYWNQDTIKERFVYFPAVVTNPGLVDYVRTEPVKALATIGMSMVYAQYANVLTGHKLDTKRIHQEARWMQGLVFALADAQNALPKLDEHEETVLAEFRAGDLPQPVIVPFIPPEQQVSN